jgi:hypothetical protein
MLSLVGRKAHNFLATVLGSESKTYAGHISHNVNPTYTKYVQVQNKVFMEKGYKISPIKTQD